MLRTHQFVLDGSETTFTWVLGPGAPGAPGTGPDPVIDQDDKAPESCTNAGHESTMYFRDQRYKRNRSVSIPVLECFVRVLVAV